MNGNSPSSPIPLYHRVFGVLRQRVLDGTYLAGDQLAPEDELAAEFKVSRATIRQAVGELVNAGIVYRQQGRGTFVQPIPRQELGQVFQGSLLSLVQETKRARIQNVVIDADAQFSQRVAASLGLEDGRGTVVRRVRLMDDVPFAYTVNYLPPKYGKLMTIKELKQVSLMQLLENKGVVIDAANQSIRAQLSDVQVAEQLQIEVAAPVLFVERLLFDRDRNPIEFVQSWYRGDTYVYQVNLGAEFNGKEFQDHFA